MDGRQKTENGIRGWGLFGFAGVKQITGKQITVIAEFLFRAGEIKISATSRASGVRALARDCFKNRLSAEVADSDFVASAMTVILRAGGSGS